MQIGSPRDLYDRPNSRYVADFVGKSNFFAGPRLAHVTSVRPEMIELAATEKELAARAAVKSVPAKVLNRIFVGDFTQYRIGQ